MGENGKKSGVAIPSGYRTLKQQDRKAPGLQPPQDIWQTTTRVLHFAQGNGGKTLCKFAILALDNRMCYNV